MRSITVEEFHETIFYCFKKVLQEMLGLRVRDEVFRLLSKHRITQSDFGMRFDDVVQVMTDAFGESARVLVHKIVLELYKEYSQRPDFTYADQLRDRIELLKLKVVADILKPRRLYSDIDQLYVPGPVHYE